MQTNEKHEPVREEKGNSLKRFAAECSEQRVILRGVLCNQRRRAKTRLKSLFEQSTHRNSGVDVEALPTERRQILNLLMYLLSLEAKKMVSLLMVAWLYVQLQYNQCSAFESAKVSESSFLNLSEQW